MVEDEFSKNLDFSLEHVGKVIWIVCGKQRVALPENIKWKGEIFKEPSTGIPFVSDGKVSKRCVDFSVMMNQGKRR